MRHLTLVPSALAPGAAVGDDVSGGSVTMATLVSAFMASMLSIPSSLLTLTSSLGDLKSTSKYLGFSFTGLADLRKSETTEGSAF